MRQIEAHRVTELVEQLCIEACCVIARDIEDSFINYRETERSPLGQQVLGTLIENASIAREGRDPLCQDTGMTVVFVTMGQEVHVTGGFIEDAINKGVRQGYVKGFLRKSVVEDPFNRVNTGDNTPAVIHYEMVPGDTFRVTVAPKGFGSENKSALRMLTPSEGVEGVKRFVIDTVATAGASACPPVIVGVGIGGTMERAAYLAKKALLRPVGTKNEDEELVSLEAELLEKINRLGIGPAGLGGSTTALAVHVITQATHIAGLPVAVNIGCHATRHASGAL